MAYDTVKLDITDGAARITLNRPDTLNAWNEQFGRELLAVVASVADDEAVRAVLITGAGRGFSSGAARAPISSSTTIRSRATTLVSCSSAARSVSRTSTR